MAKKILMLTFVLIFILSMSTYLTDVNANIQNNYGNIGNTQYTDKNEIQITDDKHESNLENDSNVVVLATNFDSENSDVEGVQNEISIKVQYTITEAPGKFGDGSFCLKNR